jgi:LCP family protein required for cell wall assembly
MTPLSGDGGRGRRLDGMSVRRSVATSRVQPVSVPVAVSQPPRQVRQRSTRRSGRLWVKLALMPLIAVIALGGWVFWPRGGNHKLSALALASSVVKTSVGDKAVLKGQSTGRTNILVYGMTKDGLRTDSIMLMSYYWQQKKLVTLNIPRDLQVNDGYEVAKFGEVYSYAFMRNKKATQYPSNFVAQLVAKEYDINVDYWVKFNMEGEVDLVNTLGGVDVTVPNSFTDYEYPTWNYTGYIHPAPHFAAGPAHLDGDTALIFSRSRHSRDNNEGTDFARSKRQMLVLAAVMSKVKSLGIVGNLSDIDHYLTILGKNIDTNMTTDELVSLATTAKALDPANDLMRGSWEAGNGFLCDSKTSAGAYITLYGTGADCHTQAGGQQDSKYRELALYFVAHALDVAGLATAEYPKAALPHLGGGYAVSASPTPAVLGQTTKPAGSGG